MDEIFTRARILNTIQSLFDGKYVIIDKRKFFLGKADGKYTLCIEADRFTRENGEDKHEKTYIAYDMPFGEFLNKIIESPLGVKENEI